MMLLVANFKMLSISGDMLSDLTLRLSRAVNRKIYEQSTRVYEHV
jgi:hypothetical protein